MSMTYGFSNPQAYDSAVFSATMNYLHRDSVSTYSGQFSLVLTVGMSFTVNPGFAYVAGRYFSLTKAVTFQLDPASVATGRYDAVALVVDLTNRDAQLRVLTDIDPEAPTRDASVYQLYLYTIEVPVGAVVLTTELVTDRRVLIDPLGHADGTTGVSELVNGVYNFATGGADATVAGILQQGTDAITEATSDMTAIQAELVDKINPTNGTLKLAHQRPADGWSLVTSITPPDSRFNWWRYTAST